MSEDNTPERIARRWYQELWNDDDITAIDRLLAEECCIHGLGEEPVRSRDGFKAFYRQIGATFSELTTTVDRVADDGRFASGMATVLATHAGSGEKVTFEVAFFLECENGVVIRGWNVIDWVPLLVGSGAVTAATVAGMFGEG